MPVFHFLIPVMKPKKPAVQTKQPFHHNVYVILLKDAVARHPSILRLESETRSTEALRVCWHDRNSGRSPV